MNLVYAGIFLFALPHLYSLLMPGSRDRLYSRIGEGRYKGLYSILSLAGLALLAVGYLKSRSGTGPEDLVYEPLLWARHLMMLLVLAGFILISANQSKGYISAWLRHPFSIGIGLWSIGHLLMNGERAVVLIFATFLILSLLDIILGLARGSGPLHTPNWTHDMRAVIIGTVVFLIAAYGFHPYVLNISVMG
jgi:uncharacterized membrane protein